MLSYRPATTPLCIPVTSVGAAPHPCDEPHPRDVWYWQAVTIPADITEVFLAGTRDLLVELNNQPDQSTQIREEIDVALDEQTHAQNTIRGLQIQIATEQNTCRPNYPQNETSPIWLLRTSVHK